jgi:hypothetical protein
MIRFIDLGKQIASDETDPDYPRQFAFYNTISDQFLSTNGGQVWYSWDDFLNNAALELSLEMIERCRSLCPAWVFDSVLEREERR